MDNDSQILINQYHTAILTKRETLFSHLYVLKRIARSKFFSKLSFSSKDTENTSKLHTFESAQKVNKKTNDFFRPNRK